MFSGVSFSPASFCALVPPRATVIACLVRVKVAVTPWA